MKNLFSFVVFAGVATSAIAANNVLVWSTGNLGSQDVGDYLTASGAFDSVTVIESDATLSLGTLTAYDRVLYFSNSSAGQDPTAIGDVLADFADTGRRLAIGVFSWADQGGNTLGGRIMTDQISPFAVSGSSIYNEVALASNDGSAFWTGVNTLSAGYRDNVSANPGATVRGLWADGVPALATKGNVVGVNMFPDLSYGFYSGDAQQLFVNALGAIPTPGTAGIFGLALVAAGRRRR